MAGTPRYKIYRADGEYVAACKYAEESAMLVSMLGDGTTIRDGHTKADIVWTEGKERQLAGESYDFVAEVISYRSKARHIRSMLKHGYREEKIKKILRQSGHSDEQIAELFRAAA